MEVRSSEDIEDVIDAILQNGQNSRQKMEDLQEKFDKVLANKDDEISYLGIYNQALLARIKKLKKWEDTTKNQATLCWQRKTNRSSWINDTCSSEGTHSRLGYTHLSQLLS